MRRTSSQVKLLATDTEREATDIERCTTVGRNVDAIGYVVREIVEALQLEEIVEKLRNLWLCEARDLQAMNWIGAIFPELELL